MSILQNSAYIEQLDCDSGILQKAQEDPDFRNSLIRDPRSVILAETGIDLSDDKLIFASDEIRKGIAGSDGENSMLTREELAQISAGYTWHFRHLG